MRSVAARIAGVVACAVSVAACTTAGQQPTGSLQAGQRTTVAFESIDGPPPAVFQRLVGKLNDEAEARQVPVVTREGFAPYRVKGYLALGVRRGQTTVAWVWDVYDSQSGRAVRLSGEEKAGRAGRDAWQSVNDEVLTRIARSGMEQLAVYFRDGDTAPSMAPAPAPVPSGPGTAVAANDDYRPEAYGITRRPPAAEPAPTETARAPLPPSRKPATGRVALVGQQ